MGGSAFRGSIRIVLVDAFTGPSAAGAAALENSLQLEIDALNASGGLLGRRVELVAADDEARTGKSADLVREYLVDERVGLLVGPGTTATFAAARPLVDQARVPNCLPGQVADSAAAGAAYTFRTRPADRTATAALLDYLRRHTQVRRLGGLTATEAEAQALDQRLGAAAPAAGIAYAGSVFVAGAEDAPAAVQQLAGRGAQGLVLTGDAAVAGAAAGAVQRLGLRDRLPAFGFDELARMAYSDQAADAAVGTVVVATIHDLLTASPSSDWPGAYREFVSGVAARYGYAPNGVEIKGLPEAAECVALWARAVQHAGTLDGQRVVRAWEQLDVSAADAILGVRERFAPGQHDAVGSDGLFVYQWTKLGDRYRLKPVQP